MTWTAIIFDGYEYTKEIFYGSHDSNKAMSEAHEKFGGFPARWGEGRVYHGKNIVVIIPGENLVYINENKT
jgi:hypothetical protein